MDKLKFKLSKIIARQILLYFIDVNRAVLPFFDKYRTYRIAFKEYDEFRANDKEKFRKEIYRLKQEKFIKKYYENKICYLELTAKGKEKLKRCLADELELPVVDNAWDGKWRMVIFDIPNEKSKSRDYLRRKLLNYGFLELQKSIYVFPFDCLNEINFLKNTFYLKPYVQYIVADRIETETDLITIFLDRNILTQNMLDKVKRVK